MHCRDTAAGEGTSSLMTIDFFHLGLFLTAACAGVVASVAGFGIGSLLTALLGMRLETKLAVAVVAIPHLIGTSLRFAIMRGQVDRRVFLRFGTMSAAGGLAGALLHTYAESPILTAVFGCLLIFTGVMGLFGLDKRLQLRGWMGWAAGALSGLLGGLVGNQGGIRSAAMLGFDVPKQTFVATATAIGLVVDGARLPVYLWTQGRDIASAWPYVATATGGVVLGTLVGKRVLQWIPETIFRRVVAAIVLALGLFMLTKSFLG
jgi:uncharacterized protein